MMRPEGIARSAAVLLYAIVLVCGCGGAGGGSAASTTPISEAQEVLPPTPVMPADLWQLVPPEALVVADLDVARLRQWTQIGTMRQWAQRYGCVTSEDLEVFDGIDRVLLAVGPEDLLVLVQGRSVGEGDVPASLRDEARDASVTFRALVPGTVLFATRGWSDAVEARLVAPGAESVRSTTFVSALSPLLDVEGAVLLVMSAPPPEVAQKVTAVLTQWGVAKIGQGLSAHAHWGLSVRLDSDSAGIGARGAVAGGTEVAAASLVDSVNSTFWQAGLVMRLFGLPAVLSSARFQQAGGAASVDVQATASDLNALAPRLEELIKARALACTPTAAGPLEVTP